MICLRIRQIPGGVTALILLMGMAMSTAHAQQKPHYTQYILNQYILNPALTGIENYTDLKLSHRRQWVGLQDAPITSYLSIHTALGKGDPRTSATSMDVYGDATSSRGSAYWDEYSAAPNHHGVGLQIIQDQAGPFRNTSVMATYAYHLGLNAKTNLSAGFGVGYGQLALNMNKLFFGPDVPVDPAIAGSGVLNRGHLDMNAGLWLYSDRYFFGIAGNQLVPQKIEYAQNLIRLNDGKWVPHFFATAGYRFLLSEDINLIPSVMVKKVDPVPIQYDLNAKIQYRDLLWAGATYRGQYGSAAMAGFNAMGRLTISYSYDYTTTRLNTVSQGTHEILIGYLFHKKDQPLKCPERLW